MVRDTLLGFPSHSLPYRYRKSYHFIDRLKHAAPGGMLFLLSNFQKIHGAQW